MVNKENFSEILRELMIDVKLNQSEFADKIGVKQCQISEWLSGKNKPRYDSLKAICEAFDISADVLLGLKDF